MIRRRSKPRRGRIVDLAFLEFMHQQGRCAVHGFSGCTTPFSAHHVRFCGGSKDDRRALGLCWEVHLHDYGKYSIERLGKASFEAHHGISIEAEITRYNEDYAAETTDSVSTFPRNHSEEISDSPAFR